MFIVVTGAAGFIGSNLAKALSERGELVADPEIELTGIPETAPDGTAFADSVYDAVVGAFESMPKARRRDPDAVAEAARRAVRAELSAQWGKKPMCHVQVLLV